MANENEDISPFLIETAAVIVIGSVILTCYLVPQLITFPWATFRFIESFMWTHVIGLLPFTDFFSLPHQELRNFLININWVNINYTMLFEIEDVLSLRTTWIYFLIPLTGMVKIIQKKTLPYKLTKRLDLEAILEQESHVWRYTRYLVKFNPQKYSMHVNKSIFAMRESIYTGLKRTQSLVVNRRTNEVVIDEKRLTKVMKGQLTRPISSPSQLTGNAKFLFCIFSLREDSLPNINTDADLRKQKLIRNILRLIRFSITRIPFLKSKKLDFMVLDTERVVCPKNGKAIDNEQLRIALLGDISFQIAGEFPKYIIDKHIERVFEQAIKNKQILEFCSQHAFEETMLRRLIFEGRRYGKMPPNHFSWLKMTDRHLWYSLCDEGLPGAAFECAGVFAHYELEKGIRMPLRFPHVGQILKNLPKVGSMSEFDAIPFTKEHPYAELYPYNPDDEYNEHIERIKTDTEYKLLQMQLEQQKL